MAKKREDAPLPNDSNEPFDDLDGFDTIEDAFGLTDDVTPETPSQVNLGDPPAGIEPSGVSIIDWSSLVEEESLREPESEEILAVEEAIEAELEAEIEAEIMADGDSAVNFGIEPMVLAEGEDDLLLPPTSSAILNDPGSAMVLDDELEAALALNNSVEETPSAVELAGPASLPHLPDVTGVNLDQSDEDEFDILEPELVGDASSVSLNEEIFDPEVVESSSGISIHDMGLEEVPFEPTAENPGAGEELFENSGELVLEEIVQQDASGHVELGEEVLLGAESPSQRDLIAEAVESGVDLPNGVRGMMHLSEDSEVHLGEVGEEVPSGRSEEIAALMDNLSSDQTAHVDLPLAADDDEVEEVATTEMLAMHAEESLDSDTVEFDGSMDEPVDEAMLKTGARIPRPDSLGDIDWQEGVAGEMPATMPEQADEDQTVAWDTDPPESGGEDTPFETMEDDNPDQPQEEYDEQTQDPDADPDVDPEPRQKPRSSAGAWMGGILMGAVLTGGGLYGAKQAGYDVLSGGATQRPTTDPEKKAPTFAEFASAVNSGDYQKAEQLGFDNAPANTSEEQAQRGQFRFRNQLRKFALANNPIDPEHEAFQGAVEDLRTAGTADAQLSLIQLYLRTGKLTEARDVLKAARANDELKADPRFDAAGIRLDLAEKAKMAPGVRRDDPNLPLILLALSIGLQEPVPVPVPGTPTFPEAGLPFLQALAAREANDFSTARTKLGEAMKRHLARRDTRPGLSQNPATDPGEEIFVDACKALIATWDAQEKLANKLAEVTPESKADPDKAFANAMTAIAEGAAAKKSLTETMTKLTSAETDLAKASKSAKLFDGVVAELFKKDEINEMTADKAIERAKTVASIAAMKDPAGEIAKLKLDATTLSKEAETAKARVTTLTETHEKALTDLDTKHKTDVTTLKDTHTKAIDTQKKDYDDKLTKQKDAADKALADEKKAGDDKLAVQKDTFEKAAVETKKTFDTALADRRRGAEILPTYLQALQERGSGLETAAAEDVERVTRDKEANDLDKARAKVIDALVLRNRGKFPEANEIVKAGVAGLEKGSAWVGVVDRLKEETANPTAFLTKQVDELSSRPQVGPAMKLIEMSLMNLPEAERPKMQARMAQLRLDALRLKTSNRFNFDDPELLAAEREAQSAVAAGLAEGHFALGRISESRGDY